MTRKTRLLPPDWEQSLAWFLFGPIGPLSRPYAGIGTFKSCLSESDSHASCFNVYLLVLIPNL